jgi:hypothetical protein
MVNTTKDYCKITGAGYTGQLGSYFDSRECIFVQQARGGFSTAYGFGKIGTTLGKASKAAGIIGYVFMGIDAAVTFVNNQKAALFLAARYTVSTAAGIGVTAALAAPTLGLDAPVAVGAGILAGIAVNSAISATYSFFGIEDH